jgi:drug/metabolite transporter (DMT)-like permease
MSLFIFYFFNILFVFFLRKKINEISNEQPNLLIGMFLFFFYFLNTLSIFLKKIKTIDEISSIIIDNMSSVFAESSDQKLV